jgi:ATP-dependent DNA helicase PIF1
MTNRVLHVKIITGPCAGEQAFIPQITLTSMDELPFELHRRQFPVRLAFAMTINKSQGQSLGTVGLDLRDPVFAHGQFYVGVSRGTNWSRVKVLLKEGREAMNIVYKDVLLRPN